MGKMVTVNLFDVDWNHDRSQPLEETLEEFGRLPLGHRWRDDVRLERVEAAQVLKDSAYLLDFARKREVGPGKLADTTAITNIRMEESENFGEETAALYVPRRRWLLVLHNQAGIGPTRMMSYLNALDPGNAERHFDYSASPKLDSTILQKLKEMQKFTGLTVTATVDALDAAQSSLGTSLAEATRPAKARRINFHLAANEPHKKGRFLDRGHILRLIHGLRREDEDSVTKLQVTGESPDVAGKDMLIDLIRHKIRRKYDASELKVIEHRYTRRSRWDLLDRSLRGWQNTL